MNEKKFNIGDKVVYKGEVHEVREVKFTYFPEGAWWVYVLENGVSTSAKDLTLATTPQEGEDAPTEPKNKEKRHKFGKK